MTENEVAKIIVDAAFTVHTRLGPGLLVHKKQLLTYLQLADKRLGLLINLTFSVGSCDLVDCLGRSQ